MQEIGKASQTQRLRQKPDVRRVRSISEWLQPTLKQLQAVAEEIGEPKGPAFQSTGHTDTSNPVRVRKISAVEYVKRKSPSSPQEFAPMPNSPRPNSLGMPDNLYSPQLLSPQQLSPAPGSQYISQYIRTHIII